MSYQYVSAQDKANISSSTIGTIQFKYNKVDNIIIEAILNQRDTISIMFHTAIGSVSLTPEMTSLLISKEKKSSNSISWTGSKEVNYTENNSLKLPNQFYDNLTVWVDMLSGPETDGKFGPNLFEGKIIEVDNDFQFIALHEPETFHLDNNNFQKFKLLPNENNSLIIEGEIMVNNQIIKNKFLIHSGYGGTIILDDRFFKSNSILHDLKIIEENDLKDSHGNVIKTKKINIDSFKFGNLVFNNLPISYFDSKLEIQKTSVIGCEILRRGNFYFDIRNSELYISKNNQTTESFKI